MSILSIMSMSIMSIISTPAFPHRRVFNSASGVIVYVCVGGQFSWVEVMGTMRQPQRFPAAVAACTGIMTAAYLSVGAVGYWSKVR